MLTSYLRFAWPIHRMLVKNPTRCKNCILPEAYTAIGEDGLCTECRLFASPVTSQPSRLKSIPPGNGKYDATLLLSGGKDSAYILHRMRREYPSLKILAICVNNGFMSKWAIKNAQLAADKSSVDMITINSQVFRCRAAIAKAMLDLKGRGCYEVVDFADGNEIFRIARETTRSLGIETMISGLSWVQLKRILGVESHFTYQDGLTEIFPLAAWLTDEQEIRQYVRDYRLLHGKSDDPLASNSRLIPSMIALDIKNLGYSSFEPEMAQLIREGKSSRDAWVGVFDFIKHSVDRGWLDKELDALLSELGLSAEEVLCKKHT